MADIRSKLTEFYSLEQMSLKNTVIHKIHPFSKLISTIIYIMCVVSLDRYSFQSLSFYFFYPVITIALAEIPFKMIIKRVIIALPFCVFAGISNIIFDKTIIFSIGGFTLTGGVCSFITIMVKSFLCVASVLILIATTPFSKLTLQLKRMYIPDIIIMLIEMIYRYIGVLMMQADSMMTAYKLRSPYSKFPHIKDMGSFIGQLFIHSADRAERIYKAMKCRGYGTLHIKQIQKKRMILNDYIFMSVVCLSSLMFLITGGQLNV